MPQRKQQRTNGKMPEARASPGELAERHLGLVIHIARDFRERLPPCVSFDDLVGAGNLGLVEAARRFQPETGVSFATFARHRIRGAIADSLRKADHIPRCRRAQQKAADLAFFSLSAALGRIPTDAEIAARLELSESRWQKLRNELHKAGCPIGGQSAANIALPAIEQLPGTRPEPERLAELAKLREILGGAIRTLQPRYRSVVLLYHFREWTMKRIGAALGVNESRISQIHAVALGHLRAHLASRGLDPATG